MTAGKLLKSAPGLPLKKIVEGLHECMSVVPRIQAHDPHHAIVSCSIYVYQFDRDHLFAGHNFWPENLIQILLPSYFFLFLIICQKCFMH
jgi:hypothetical protein